MNGWERLKEEMKNRGCSDQQIESKAVSVVVDILAQTGTEWLGVYEARKEKEKALKEKGRQVRRKEIEHERLEREIKEAKKERDEMYRAKSAITDEIYNHKRYIEKFEESLKECDSDEGKDAMRAAQFFIQNTKVETPQNNTAFINGLAMILSQGGVGGLGELKRLDADDIEGKAKARSAWDTWDTIMTI